MEQDYIRAYQLLSEFTDIINMPDSVSKAVQWHEWTVKAEAWNNVAKPRRAHLRLAQSICHLQQQNHDVISPLTLKI
jgi:hypothetical protein